MPTFIFAAIASATTYLTKTHLILFVLYFLMNVLDLISGILASRARGGFSSKVFSAGVLKKVGYWVVILLAFVVHLFFKNFESVIGVDLTVTQLLGWYVLSAFVFVEIRSIFDNLKTLGIEVPPTFVKLLSLSEKAIEGPKDTAPTVDATDETTNHLP